jgi:hypothetical protein
VVVLGGHSTWNILNKLREIVKEKQRKYQTSEEIASYNYETYNLTDTSGYGFKSEGCLFIPILSKSENAYLINPENNTVRYKDETACADFYDMRRILYHDFIQLFNNSFINNHTFTENSEYERENKALVWLSFKLNKDSETNGYLIIDTLENVIIESEYAISTDQNIKNNTSSLLRNFASKKQGFQYNEWITKTKTKYGKTGRYYRMTECSFKSYMKTSVNNKKVNAEYFLSTESRLYLSENRECESVANWLKLPVPRYIVAIYTKAMRSDDEALKNVQRKYEDF